MIKLGPRLESLGIQYLRVDGPTIGLLRAIRRV